MRVFLNNIAASAYGVFHPHPQGKAIEIPDAYARDLVKAGYARKEVPDLEDSIVEEEGHETASLTGGQERAVTGRQKTK